MSEQIAEIARVTQMILDAELARLKEVSAEVATLRAALDGLDGEVRRRAAQIAGSGDADCARLAGRDGPWLDWVAARRRALNRALAEASARREAQRVVTRRAFGRVEAVSGLVRLEEDGRRQVAARRRISAAT